MEPSPETFPSDPQDRANALYWDSDWSVNRIAQELDLSRSALYASIDPLGVGLPCPTCGEELQYSNRTARERGLLACGACGLEGPEEVLLAAVEEGLEAGDLEEDSPRVAPQAWGTGVLITAAVLAVSAGLFYVMRRRRY